MPIANNLRDIARNGANSHSVHHRRLGHRLSFIAAGGTRAVSSAGGACMSSHHPTLPPRPPTHVSTSGQDRHFVPPLVVDRRPAPTSSHEPTDMFTNSGHVSVRRRRQLTCCLRHAVKLCYFREQSGSVFSRRYLFTALVCCPVRGTRCPTESYIV